MYHMPRIEPDINICGPVDWQCYDDVKDAMDLGVSKNFTCTCIPACFGINYDTETSVSRLLDNSHGIREKMLREMPSEYRQKNIAVLQIYYKENFFRSQNKEELIGFTEFLCESLLHTFSSSSDAEHFMIYTYTYNNTKLPSFSQHRRPIGAIYGL